MADHEQQEEATEAAERDMEHDAGEMEEGVERLEQHIEKAERAASERPEATGGEAAPTREGEDDGPPEEAQLPPADSEADPDGAPPA
jgi:hypothetical protein